MTKGTYVLLIENKKEQEIEIGKLGKFNFPEGHYAYIGSALGESVNLENRVKRHLSPASEKKLQWNIDYFLGAEEVEVKDVMKFPGKELECELAGMLLGAGKIVAERFGSSDCRCKTHLVYLGSLDKTVFPFSTGKG